MAKTIHGEARGESDRGQVMVGLTILNRQRKYGGTICSVVRSKGQFFISKKYTAKERRNAEEAIYSYLPLTHKKPKYLYFNSAGRRYKDDLKIGNHFFREHY